MKYAKYSPLIFAVIILTGYYFSVYKKSTAEPVATNSSVQNQLTEGQSSQDQSTQTASAWETKTDERQPVSVIVTPTELGKEAQQWTFKITYDTHSVDLNHDPLQTSVLVDDQGNTYKPTAWEGPGPGGHHRAGVLVFNPIQPMSNSIELKIQNVGSIAERSFTWEVK